MDTKRCHVRGNYVDESNGYAAEIFVNIVLVLAYQAPADAKILSGEVWKVSDELYGMPVPSEEGLRNRGCELDWQLGDISVICENAACHIHPPE